MSEGLAMLGNAAAHLLFSFACKYATYAVAQAVFRHCHGVRL